MGDVTPEKAYTYGLAFLFEGMVPSFEEGRWARIAVTTGSGCHPQLLVPYSSISGGSKGQINITLLTTEPRNAG